MTTTRQETTEHTCFGRIFCGQPKATARAECPACRSAAAMIPGHAAACSCIACRQERLLKDPEASA